MVKGLITKTTTKKKCYLYEVMDMLAILIVIIILKYIYIICTCFIICTSSHDTVYFKHIQCYVNYILKLKTYLKTDEKNNVRKKTNM